MVAHDTEARVHGSESKKQRETNRQRLPGGGLWNKTSPTLLKHLRLRPGVYSLVSAETAFQLKPCAHCKTQKASSWGLLWCDEVSPTAEGLPTLELSSGLSLSVNFHTQRGWLTGTGLPATLFTKGFSPFEFVGKNRETEEETRIRLEGQRKIVQTLGNWWRRQERKRQEKKQDQIDN